MSKGAIAFLGILVVLAIVLISLVGYVISTNNMGVAIEAGIKAQYEQNKNNLAQYSNKIVEAAQVPAMYRDDYTKVIMASMQGRYGKNGSKAVFQWLKEHNINFDSSLYIKIQQMIDAGRTQFEKEQELLIDKKRQYETVLGIFPRGFVMHFIGFPKINLADYNIVINDYAGEAFKKGKENGIKLR
jgi:hypothetical protein